VSEIYIISGFLGAGKTTFIQKLLNEAFRNEKLVLIENDFGDISVDAALLKTGGIEVKELSSGCICCSLSGDFVKSLKEISERFHPDKVIIEPSGVGKLSDIIRACEDWRLKGLYEIKAKITVADIKRCRSYLDNFGEFFEDQIRNADIVLFSRSESFPGMAEESSTLIRTLNRSAVIFSEPWDSLNAEDILLSAGNGREMHIGCCHHEAHGHEHCSHGEHDEGHHHGAEEAFDTVTVRTIKKYSVSELNELMCKAEHELSSDIIRAKGIVRGDKGNLNIQYVPGSLKIDDCDAVGDMLCFIGKNLDRLKLIKLFGGK
jgi:G3E family GTPase